MKNYTKIIFIVFAFLILILLIFFIRQTYAKYISSLDGSASVTISRWNITVNNQSIKNNPDINIVPQILTNDAREFVNTARRIKLLGYDEVNLNLGCPSGTARSTAIA